MSKQPPKIDRSKLPDGWDWANWSGADQTRARWTQFDEDTKQPLRVRFMQVTATIRGGQKLPHELFYIEKGQGVAVAKTQTPNPGWRAWCFRDGNTYCITHISRKNELSHNRDVVIAVNAKAEHMAKNSKRKKNGR